jgi:hypothetical protein
MRRLLAVVMLLAVGTTAILAQGKDSEKAAATRKTLDETKITVEYKDTLLQDVIKDLADKTKAGSKQDVKFNRDPKGAATQNQKINYEAKDKTVKAVLDELCKKNDLTWTIVSGKAKIGKDYDGYVFISK